MNSARMLLATMIAIVLVSSSVALAIVPLEIGFQGRLVLSDGSPPPDDIYEITFSMWDDPTGGTELWSEIQQVQVQTTQFNVTLGTETDIPLEVLSFNYEKIYLQTQVLGDSPMMPRIPLKSVPYSLVSSRIQGDVFTQPGVISVGLQQPDFKWAEMSGLIGEAKLSLGGQEGEDIVSLSADDQGSHFFMVDSFFDVEYRIQLETTTDGGGLTISNIGSSGEDGVAMHVDPLGSRLVVSNIGSSGQDGVSINVNDGAATCGIEHEDIGGSNSFANSSADATGSIHEVGHYLSLDHTFGAGIKADDNGAGLFATDSYFDVEYRIDYHASDTEALSSIQADDQTHLFKRVDRATPNLYQATCDGSHELGHSLITQAIDDQGSSGEYRWIPEVGDEVLVEFLAGDAGGLFVLGSIGTNGQDGITMDVGSLGSNLELENGGLELSTTARLSVDDNAATCGIEHEDIGGGGGYAVNSTASASGGTLTVSNIGSSGEDGVSLHSDATHSMLTIMEGGNNTVQLSSDGTTDQLSMGDLDGEGRLDLVAGSTSGDVSVFFQDSFGNSGVKMESVGGSGGGGRVALVNQAIGDPIPIEIVALSLVSSEPIVVARNPSYSPTDPPVLEFDYDALDRLTMTLRDSEVAPGESTKTSTDGFHVFEGPSEFHFDTRGLFFSDPTGPTFSVSPLGEMNLRGGGVLASDPATTLGIGFPSPGFKLAVNGDMCVTGTYLSCSDKRYKKNVARIESGLDLISRLQGVRFNWKTEEFSDRHFSNERQVGLIAQEVEKVVPEVVSKDNAGYYSVDYARLTPILIEAIKEQQAKIETLEQTIEDNNQLRAEIQELKEIVRSLASDRDKSEVVVMTGADGL